jgi:hypothetical protein
MRGIRRLAVSVAIVIAALLVAALLSSPGNTAGPCEVTNRAMLADVPEASGLAISRRHDGLLWTHNDSGNESILFAIDTSGRARGRVRISRRLRDWEDISAAPCAAGDCLYIGDIGDNSMSRKSIQVLRVPEPDPDARDTGRPDVITLTYPDGPHNAEAMFVAAGRIFIVTRDRVGAVYRSTATPGDVLSAFNRSPLTIKLLRIGELRLMAVTDAEASPDGMSVAVRTSDEVVIYRTADLVTAPGVARPTVRIPIDRLKEPQGEAVALGGDGSLFLASEGRPWNRAGRFVMLRCNVTL